ncbi:uncharacterized protein TRAVEDRAFT_20179 [Trametes versicolor FP-101664 SS1]|uniref:uncharacterized protein n=1 Tax=Trametes versicolor (strain FP-101664) TaxID=717944 RepID=UPI00046247A4|nr:uncharacterized protein TRAVEDRAFT_20179 [Trametes versicolor FP-101664 SS1]EIW59920.1 hypothetical protein TRAVEDRAFT_20179 [Trametes versicolor FP-101664 SS1]
MSITPAIDQLGNLANVDSFWKNAIYGIVPIVLNGYEYLITLDQEVTLFWRRKWTGATVLFFATRYLGLLSFTILTAATYAPLSDKKLCLWLGPKSCTPLAYVQAYFSVSQYIAWAAFSGLRALALSNMNWALASAVFILGLGPFASNMWALSSGLTGISVPPFGCGGVAGLTPNMSEL